MVFPDDDLENNDVFKVASLVSLFARLLASRGSFGGVRYARGVNIFVGVCVDVWVCGCVDV